MEPEKTTQEQPESGVLSDSVVTSLMAALSCGMIPSTPTERDVQIVLQWAERVAQEMEMLTGIVNGRIVCTVQNGRVVCILPPQMVH